MLSMSHKTRAILLFAMSLCWIFISSVFELSLLTSWLLAIAGLVSLMAVKKEKKDER